MTGKAKPRPAKRHQSTPACARCYRLKQKCDRGSPKCLRCAAAGVDCRAVDRQTSAELPRSIVQFLEQKIAELRRIHTVQGHSGDVALAKEPGAVSSVIEMPHKLFEFAVEGHLGPCLITNDPSFVHAVKLFYPSERPPLKIPVRGIYFDIRPRTAGRAYGSQFSELSASKIPLHVAKRLFVNYRDKILPQFPCFFEDDVAKIFQQFYNEPGSNEPQTRLAAFAVPLILAISSLASNGQDFPKVAALSEALHKDSMRYISVLHDTSIPALQCLLLLIQYALYLPYSANLWYLGGEAMRIAISLGLHYEPPRSSTVDSRNGELRKQLFWLTYQFDRVVGISGGCPVAINDDHITTSMPYNGGTLREDWEEAIAHVPNRMAKDFLLHCRVRLLQTEIHLTQFFDLPLANNTKSYDDWVQHTEERIQALSGEVAKGNLASLVFTTVAHQCRVLLYRPSSRNMAVSVASLIKAATASTQVINSYYEIVQAGGLVPTFEIANSSFQAGMVLLYALRNRSPELTEARVLGVVRNALEILVDLLESLSRRWPALSDTTHYTRELIDTASRIPLGHSGSVYDISVLKELDCLVTQRRMHSVHHRNVPFLPADKLANMSDTTSPASDNVLGDDNWWHAFIHDDPEPIDVDFEPSHPLPRFVPEQPSPPIQQKPQSCAIKFSQEEIDLDSIVSAIPSCSHCRDRRIKCHQDLPACWECLHAARECLVYDPIIGKNVPLSHIASLLEQAKSLGTQAPRPAPILAAESNRAMLVKLRSEECGIQFVCDPGSSHSLAFFGPWTIAESLLKLFRTRMTEVPTILQTALDLDHFAMNCGMATQPDIPSQFTTLGLSKLFARSANTFFPVLTTLETEQIVSQAYSERNTATHHHEAMFFLVIAIGALVGKKSDPSLSHHAQSWFRRAVSSVSPHLDHSSLPENVSLLQINLLICVFLILCPRAGDLWRHLGHAVRHLFDLSHLSTTEQEDYSDIIRTLTRTIYTLESHASIAFGRPSLLTIGDDLRKELMQEGIDTFEEKVSIFSYTIAFRKMQIQNASLRHVGSPTQANPDECRDLRRGLDEWLVHFKHFLSTLSDDEDTQALHNWCQINYYHGLHLISRVWPTPGGGPLPVCQAVCQAASQALRHQRLFARCMNSITGYLPLIVPIHWAYAHFIFQVAIDCAGQDGLPTEGDNIQIQRDSLSLIQLLEADPDNLLTGQYFVLETLYNK